MAKTLADVETFYWKGQLRYRCPMKWESGIGCEYDTYDLNQLKKHMESGHSRTIEMKTESTPVNQEEFDFTPDPKFKSVKFKESEE